MRASLQETSGLYPIQPLAEVQNTPLFSAKQGAAGSTGQLQTAHAAPASGGLGMLCSSLSPRKKPAMFCCCLRGLGMVSPAQKTPLDNSSKVFFVPAPSPDPLSPCATVLCAQSIPPSPTCPSEPGAGMLRASPWWMQTAKGRGCRQRSSLVPGCLGLTDSRL